MSAADQEQEQVADRHYLFALHGLFYAVFIPRALLHWGRPLLVVLTAKPPLTPSPTPKPPLAPSLTPKPPLTPASTPGLEVSAAAIRRRAARPPASTRSASGDRAPWFPLALHAIAMGLLYYGITRPANATPAACGGAAATGGAPQQADPLAQPSTATVAVADRATAEGAPPLLIVPRPLAGGVAILAAAGLAGWTLAVFRSWRLRARIESEHELCTAGPFRWVRHPIYLAMDLLAVGSWLWVPTAATAVGAALVALGGDLRGRSEERLLHSAFGERFDRYRRRVRRFLPGIY